MHQMFSNPRGGHKIEHNDRFTRAQGHPVCAKHACATWGFTNQWELLQCSEQLLYGMLRSIRHILFHICSQSYNLLFFQDPLPSLTALSSTAELFLYSITVLKNYSSFLPAHCGNGNISPFILTEVPEMCSSDTDISLCPKGPKIFLMAG